MKKLRIYLDTSIFGGYFDKEFSGPSKMLFEQIQLGKFDLVASDVVRDEVVLAPPKVQGLFEDFLPLAEIVSTTPEAITLQNAYLKAHVVTTSHMTDALHVALATVHHCSAIVSWNFKHIVHFQKVPLYNAINTVYGFSQIAINTPQEVILYD